MIVAGSDVFQSPCALADQPTVKTGNWVTSNFKTTVIPLFFIS